MQIFRFARRSLILQGNGTTAHPTTKKGHIAPPGAFFRLAYGKKV
jgi:hypothetical protein